MCKLLIAFILTILLPIAAVPQGQSFPVSSLISRNGSAFLGAVTASSQTASYTVGAGSNRLLVDLVLGDSIGGANDCGPLTGGGATYNGVAMVFAGVITLGQPANNRYIYYYYATSPASGTHNIVNTCGSSHIIDSVAADYTGVSSICQPDSSTITASPNGSTSWTSTIQTLSSNDWTVLAVGGFQPGNILPTAGPGATFVVGDTMFGSISLFDSGGPINPATNYSMTTNQMNGATEAAQHMILAFIPFTKGSVGGSCLSNGGGNQNYDAQPNN